MRIFPLILLVLAGCATTPKPDTVVSPFQVNKPVSKTCVPESVGGPPEYPDTDDALIAEGNDPADRYWLVAAGRLQRISRLSELETVVEGCRKK